jgi:nucleoside-specific outer membrane channel protein Tsx
MKKTFLGLSLITTFSSVHALEYSTTEIQALHGWKYKLGLEERSLATLEHSSGWDYGMNFGFIDATEPFKKKPDRNYYSELYTWLSYKKTTHQKEAKWGIFDDVLFGIGWQGDDAGFRAHLAGPSITLNLPNFEYAMFNLFAYQDQKNYDVTYSPSFAWSYPFSISNVPLKFRGFFTFTGKNGDYTWNISTQPQLLWDIGKQFFHKENTLMTGVELQMYRNKYGNKDVHEFNPQLMVTYVF